MGEVVRFGDPEALASEVAGRFLDLIADLQAAGGVPQIALTGGTIADAIHHQVAARAAASGVDWGAVEFWWSDERFVEADSADRNACQARQAFLDAVGATRVHEMPTPASACAVDEGARAYAAELRAVPRFDLVMLGMGPDGHVASLFPGRREVDIPDPGVAAVIGAPKPPPQRLTLTLPTLNNADRVWLVAADTGPGGAKHDAFELAQAGDEEIPAARVHGRDSTIWFVS